MDGPFRTSAGPKAATQERTRRCGRVHGAASFLIARTGAGAERRSMEMLPHTMPKRRSGWLATQSSRTPSYLSCSARDTASTVQWAICLPALRKTNAFIINNLEVVSCQDFCYDCNPLQMNEQNRKRRIQFPLSNSAVSEGEGSIQLLSHSRESCALKISIAGRSE